MLGGGGDEINEGEQSRGLGKTLVFPSLDSKKKNMDEKIIKRHRSRIQRGYFMRIANLIKLNRMAEASRDTLYFASILRMWAEQDTKEQERVLRGMNNKKSIA